MPLTSGQQEYLLELLSYEYFIPEECQPAVKEAIVKYANTSYSQEDLDFLVKSPQSLAALLCFHEPNQLQNFAVYYALWLNCLEHCIYQNNAEVEAICINPDPTSQQKLLAISRIEPPADEQTENDQAQPQWQVTALPLLSFPAAEDSTRSCYHSQWTYPAASQSLQQFLDYAHQEQHYGLLASKPSTWRDLYQQAKLFPLVKDNYQFTDKSLGLMPPSNLQWIRQVTAANRQQSKSKHHGKQTQYRPASVFYQRPAHPFAAEMQLFQQLKHHLPPMKLPNMTMPPAPPMPSFQFPPFFPKH